MASERRIARRAIKKEIHGIKRAINEMPILIDCSEVYGDGYFTKEMERDMINRLELLKCELLEFDKNNPVN